MEWILTQVFGQTLAPAVRAYGPLIGVSLALVVLAAFAMVALAAYYVKTRIDLMREEARAAELERQRGATAREQRWQALIEELKQGRANLEQLVKDYQTLLTNHLEHDRQEREELVSVIADLKAHSESGRRTMEACTAAFTALRIDIADRIPRKQA